MSRGPFGRRVARNTLVSWMWASPEQSVPGLPRARRFSDRCRSGPLRRHVTDPDPRPLRTSPNVCRACVLGGGQSHRSASSYPRRGSWRQAGHLNRKPTRYRHRRSRRVIEPCSGEASYHEVALRRTMVAVGRVRAVSRNRASGRRPLNRPEAENEVVPKQAAVNRDRPPAPRSHSDPIIEMVRTFLILVLTWCFRGENPLHPTKNKTHSNALKWVSKWWWPGLELNQ